MTEQQQSPRNTGAGDDGGRVPGLVPLSKNARTTLLVALLLTSILVLSSSMLVTVVHLRDRFSVGDVDGTRIALAQMANDGTLSRLS